LALPALAFWWIQTRINAPNHDNAYLLAMADGVLRGGRYYNDFFEPNPPLYVILLMPPVLLARISGAGPQAAFLAWISVLIWLSSVLCRAPLRRAVDVGPVSQWVLAVGLQAAMFFVAGRDFGQRDHLGIILMLPAVLWQATRDLPAGQARFTTPIAVLGAIGCLIKPFLVLVPLAIYVLRAAQTRDWRVFADRSVGIFLAITAAYAAVIVLVFPEWLAMVGIAREYYGAYGAAAPIASRALVVIAVILAAAVSVEFTAARRPLRGVARCLAAAALGAAGSYIVQHKGWEYHLVPVRLLAGMVVATAGLAAFGLVAGWLQGRLYACRAIAVCLAAGLVLARMADRTAFESAREDRFMRLLSDRLAELAAGRRVLVMSTSEYPAYPLNLYYDTLQASRFSHFWLLPELVLREAAGTATAPAAARFIGLVVEDFRRFSPDTLVVDESPAMQAMSEPLDFLAWFHRDPAMTGILASYERVGSVADPRTAARYNSRYGIYVKRR
jgi:hypothetical protein